MFRQKAGMLLIGALLALWQAPSATAADGQDKELHIVRLDTAPRIDGVLDEAIWEQATLVSDFHQVEPIEFAAPGERTEVRVFFTRDAVYVGARMFQDPARITANILKQGSEAKIWDDDWFGFDIDPWDAADATLLESGGWALVDPRSVAASPGSYRRYIQGSALELLVPKDMYVRGRTGWFSDRSACYLASGKPVVALDTGFSASLPVGKGLVTFDTRDQARAALHDVLANYEVHAEAARSLAEAHLDSDIVLGALLDDIGLGR